MSDKELAADQQTKLDWFMTILNCLLWLLTAGLIVILGFTGYLVYTGDWRYVGMYADHSNDSFMMFLIVLNSALIFWLLLRRGRRA